MTRTHSNLRVSHVTPEYRRAQTCGYYFLVTEGGMSHTAFDTRAGLDRWMSERGLRLESNIDEVGHSRIIGSYRTTSHNGDPGEVEQMAGYHTRTLSNGDYVVAVIAADDDGVLNVHTLNPNVRGRKVYDSRESNRLTGGNGSSIERAEIAKATT
jgi:hypothetical protein